MLTAQRQGKILDEIAKKRSVTVTELCEVLEASESTVRRDLATLDREGKLKKVHGGAVALTAELISTEPDVQEKLKLYSAEKDAIAKYAAGAINKNDLIFIDAGTTTEKLIDYIEEKGATFVTNGFLHAHRLAKRGFNVILTGGEVKPTTQALVGISCVESIKNYNFTKAFLGTNGISLENGLTTPNINEAGVKRAAAQKSYVTYILADHSKFNRTAAVTFAQNSNVCIITDRLLDERYRNITVIKEVLK